jgi:hypothetical protein
MVPEVLGKKSPIISPDRESKPAISRTNLSTLIPRGIHGDRKQPDKPITNPSRGNKPRIQPRQKQAPGKNGSIAGLVRHERSPTDATESIPRLKFLRKNRAPEITLLKITILETVSLKFSVFEPNVFDPKF